MVDNNILPNQIFNLYGMRQITAMNQIPQQRQQAAAAAAAAAAATVVFDS